jgi:Protein of unknown function (DUF998)
MTNTARPLPLLLQPASTARMRTLALAVIPLLLTSAALVVLAAWAMPEDYSWLVLSISESAAQAQQHGWIARLSFLSFGSAVLLLSLSMRDRWPRLTYWCHLVFAASMFGAAAFSHSPWQPGAPNDPAEDFLHSFFASGMGFAFCAGVVARYLQRGRGAVYGRSLDVAALLVATILPLLLASSFSVGGLMQRLMFAVAYLWYGREALIGLSVVVEQNAA